MPGSRGKAGLVSRAALERLREVFQPESLRVILFGALDRKQAEKILGKRHRADRGALAALPRETLMAEVALAFFDEESAAKAVVRAVDAATRAERSLVASIAPAEVEEKLGSLEALRFRRHAAKLLWALVRDDRVDVWPVAGRVLAEFLQQAQRIEQVRAGARRAGAEAELEELEAMYREAADRAVALQEEVSRAEKEHARLAASAGEKEARLRDETARRRELAAEISRMEKLGTPQVAPPRADDDGQLERRYRKLEKRLAAVERERDALREEAERAGGLDEENARLRRTIESLREVRVAPRPAPMPEEASVPGEPLVRPPRRRSPNKGRSEQPRVGLFLDVANLAGAARRVHDGSVNYRELLGAVVGRRRLSEARAYVIDKEADGFDAFVGALRGAGYRVFSKKPKRFDDGTVKADWDLGLAVDVMLLHDKLDVVVLGSGDGDFVPLVRALQTHGVQVEVASFPERLAAELRDAADRVFELDASCLQS